MAHLVLLMSSLLGVVAGGKLGIPTRPDPSQAAPFARWLVANGLWGVVSTVSIHLEGVPFGNIVSFSDGPVSNSTGTPYFYLTQLDPTAQDLAKDSRCSFTLSESSLGTCGKTDVESPVCSKITLSGKMLELPNDDKFAAEALFSKHPEMPGWPKDHKFQFYKLEISNIFLIDFFGGPKLLTVAEYYGTPELQYGSSFYSFSSYGVRLKTLLI